MGSKKRKFANIKIDGHIANKQAEEIKVLIEKTRLDYGKRRQPKAEFDKKVLSIVREFIRKNPDAFYSGELIYEMFNNDTDKESVKELLDIVNPNLKTANLNSVRAHYQSK